VGVPQRHPAEHPVQRSGQAVHAGQERLARIEDDGRRSELQGMARRRSGARLYARHRAVGWAARAAASGLIPGKQSGAPTAGRGEGRAVVEDGQYELF